MIELKILALIPFCGATIISLLAAAPGMETEFVQYGALGLCAIVVIFLCNHLKAITIQQKDERKQLVAELQKKNEELKKLVEANTSAFEEFAELLGDRPCIAHDARTKPR